MRVKITGIPEMKMGGILADYPYAGGNQDANPFGNISSNTTSDEENVNASAKPVDREFANMEAEKGELLLKYDLGGLFAIQGKNHSQGGTPLKADTGDFIFSKDKELAITKEEKEIFDLGKTDKYKKSESTPAKVLSKEVNPKHYNQLINILNDPDADIIAKRTAELMLGKYSDKIGQVAFLQESKKGFPQGMPMFSMGTAPVKSEELEDTEALEQQYQYGGLAEFSGGGRKRRNDKLTPNYQPPYEQAFVGPQEEIIDWAQSLQPFGYTGALDDVNAIQQWMNTNAPDSAPYVYQQGLFGLNNKKYDPTRKNFSDQYVRDQFNDGKYAEDAWTFANRDFGSNEEYENFVLDNQQVGTLRGNPYYDAGMRNRFNKPVFEIARSMQQIPITGGGMPTSGLPAPTPLPTGGLDASVTGTGRTRTPQQPNPFGGFDIPWNGQEKLTTALPFLQAFMRKDQYPMLQQIHTPDIRLDRVSNAQELSDIRQQSSLAQNELFNSMQGSNAYINAAGLRGEVLNSMGRSNAQNNNANTQIANQEDMTNYQSMINDRNFNVQQVGDTYDKSNLVLGRRQKELSDAFAQSINTGVGIQDKLDALKQSFTQSAMKSLDKNGQPRFLLDPNTRTPVLNPRWQGDILSNPFLGSTGDQTKYQQMMMKSLVEAMNSSDVRAKTYAAKIMAQLFKPDSKGQNTYEELYNRNNF